MVQNNLRMRQHAREKFLYFHDFFYHSFYRNQSKGLKRVVTYKTDLFTA